MKLILLGAPGAGKGTQADILKVKLNIPTISTGNILRAAVKNGTPTGLKAKEYMDAGKLVPDEVIIGMVENRIQAADCQKGYLFDGFPRTIAQADALLSISDIDMVVNIDVPAERLVERIGGRRMCAGCGAGYHVSMYSKDTCEKCGAKLFIRDDDKPETVLNRITVYERQTQPLIDYYKAKGLLRTVDGDRTPETVRTDILALTEKLV